MHKSLRAQKLSILLIPLITAELAALLSNLHWGFELFSHYIIYYLITEVLLLVFLQFSSYKRSSNQSDQKSIFSPVTILPIFFIIFHIFQIIPFYIPSTTEKETKLENAGPEIKVLSSNFFVENENFSGFKKLIDQENPDIFAILEAEYAWKTEKNAYTKYPYIEMSEKTGSFGSLIFSKYETTFNHFTLGDYETLEATIKINEQEIRLIAVHPTPPASSKYAKIRNYQYNDLIEKINESDLPTIVMGDFNSSPWSPKFKEILSSTNLKLASLGFGIETTWNASIPILRIPIDHILVSPEIEVTSFYTGPFIGSDHYPVIATLKLP